MIKKILVLGMLVGSFLWGQRSDTIYQQVTFATTNLSNPVTNIGQAGHTAYILLSGTSCPSTTIGISQANFQYSWDGTNYTNITPLFLAYSGGPVTPTTKTVITATGAYPFVRLQVLYDTTNCTLSAFYVGNVVTPYPLVGGSPREGTPVVMGTNNPVSTGKVVGVATWNAGAAIYVGQGFIGAEVIGGATANISVGVGTTVSLTNSDPVTGKIGSVNRVYIDHMELTADTNATVVTLLEGHGTNCGTGSTTLGSWILNVGQPLLLQRIRSQTLSDAVCLSAATGSIKGSWTYGVMQSGNFY